MEKREVVNSGLNVRVIGTLIAGMLQISCWHPAFAQQTPPERQINATGYGPSIEIATKNALSNAVAAICGQRITGSQNLESLSRTQSALDKGGKDVSFEQSKTTQDNINAISDGLIEKFEILDQRDWNEQKKVDVSVTVSKCYNLDRNLEVLQTNKLLSSILEKIDKNSDARGIKEDDNRWEVMAKEMWYANFAAYMRQGQFKSEEQAKLALEKGLHNKQQLENEIDGDIFRKLNAPGLAKENLISLLRQISDSPVANMQHDNFLDRMLHNLQLETLVYFETVQKCGSRAQKGSFVWGAAGNPNKPSTDLQNFVFRYDDLEPERAFLNRAMGVPLPEAEEDRLAAISLRNSNLDAARVLHGLKVSSVCRSGQESGRSGKILAFNEDAQSQIRPICAEIDLLNSLMRERKPLSQRPLQSTEIYEICSLSDEKIIKAYTEMDSRNLSFDKRREVLSQHVNGDIISDYLNIKYADIEVIYRILTNGWVTCSANATYRQEYPKETRIHVQAISIHYCDGLSKIDWVGNSYVDSEAGSGKMILANVRRKFCDVMNGLKINLYDQSFLNKTVSFNGDIRGRGSLDDAFSALC